MAAADMQWRKSKDTGETFSVGCLGWVTVALVPEHLITWHNLLCWVSCNRARISVSLLGFTPSLARTSQLQITNKQGHQL